jgi:hypothetical protein
VTEAGAHEPSLKSALTLSHTVLYGMGVAIGALVNLALIRIKARDGASPCHGYVCSALGPLGGACELHRLCCSPISWRCSKRVTPDRGIGHASWLTRLACSPRPQVADF